MAILPLMVAEKTFFFGTEIIKETTKSLFVKNLIETNIIKLLKFSAVD